MSSIFLLWPTRYSKSNVKWYGTYNKYNIIAIANDPIHWKVSCFLFVHRNWKELFCQISLKSVTMVTKLLNRNLNKIRVISEVIDKSILDNFVENITFWWRQYLCVSGNIVFANDLSNHGPHFNARANSLKRTKQSGQNESKYVFVCVSASPTVLSCVVLSVLHCKLSYMCRVFYRRIHWRCTAACRCLSTHDGPTHLPPPTYHLPLPCVLLFLLIANPVDKLPARGGA